MIQELADQIGVPFTKVYKWNWERKKKELNPYFHVNSMGAIYPMVRPTLANSDQKPYEELEKTESEDCSSNH